METENVNYTSASGLTKNAPSPTTVKDATAIVKSSNTVSRSLMLP
jgi:hypothetical protein